MISEPSEHICIRPMTEADLDEVLAIEQSCYAFPWSAGMFLQELANPFATIDLLLIGDRVAGHLCSWFLAAELHVLNVATAPAFRRRGVGSRLLEHVMARAQALGMIRGFLEVRAGNAPAIELYRSFGFRPAGTRHRYYPDGEDALLMEYTAEDRDKYSGARIQESE